jgi:hypothetical protein
VAEDDTERVEDVVETETTASLPAHADVERTDRDTEPATI